MKKLALLALPLAVLAACSSVTSGIVTGKEHVPENSYTCETGSIPINAGNGVTVTIPIYGTCTDPECWQIDLRNGDDTGSVCTDENTWNNLYVGQNWSSE